MTLITHSYVLTTACEYRLAADVQRLEARVAGLEAALRAQPDQCSVDPIPASSERRGDYMPHTLLKHRALKG